MIVLTLTSCLRLHLSQFLTLLRLFYLFFNHFLYSCFIHIAWQFLNRVYVKVDLASVVYLILRLVVFETILLDDHVVIHRLKRNIVARNTDIIIRVLMKPSLIFFQFILEIYITYQSLFLFTWPWLRLCNGWSCI